MASLVLLCLAALAGGNGLGGSGAVEADARPLAAISGTPVPAAEASDPLDGDPLDGPPRPARPGADDLVAFEIVRSGRPSDAPNSVDAYDGDPETTWSVPGVTDDTWVWVDLGEARRLREVRWLAQGRGTIVVDVSSDRKTWRHAGAAAVHPGWQQVEVTGEARYARLSLTADDDGQLPAIAEIATYGVGRGRGETLAQDAKQGKNQKRDRTRDDDARNRDRSKGNDSSSNEVERGTRAESVPGVTVEPGETDCRGKRARCRAKEGEVSVEKDGCDSGGSCTIDIVANGGTATCDASGGDENKAGRGKGKSTDNGGRCEATANGGAVTIGDIDP